MAMMEAMEKQKQETKPNFVINKKDCAPAAAPGLDKVNTLCFFIQPFTHSLTFIFFPLNQFATVAFARSEMSKTKEQLTEDKDIALSFRVKPLEIEGLSTDKLRQKAQQLWDQIVQLESDKYDLEERQKRQDYDVS